ncbi:MAG: 6-phosphogluconolactonase [Planctomycetota bacterium]|nr:6-phosphogluconolactonase [Planctomycetota bacterium]
MTGDSHEDEIQLEPLEHEIDRPQLPGRVLVRHDPEDLYDALASDLMLHSANCVRQFGDFHLALSGGRTPFPLYERLMYDPRFRIMPWRRTHLWIVDERCVPFESELSNFSRIKEVIVDHSDIPPEQVHPMLANSPGSAERYERELRDTLGWRPKGHDRLDFVLLGMGLDGHTASIFPGSPALHATDRLALDVPAPTTSSPAVPRCTLTMPMLNAARFVAPLIMGADKCDVLRRIAAGASPDELPIAGLRPVAGELRWYLDAAACGKA